MNGTAITTLDPPMQKVEHQVTPRELLDVARVERELMTLGPLSGETSRRRATMQGH